ncbi:hypothetical protein OTK01_000414 [Caldicellulosiruptor acetigenus]|nr:hypothetical protein [Caldicellulosiruptor acetigenus]WAM36637.1 hypothetical protein OTK01_000414 [Caldicellulosiruptor acetigenus]
MEAIVKPVLLSIVSIVAIVSVCFAKANFKIYFSLKPFKIRIKKEVVK